MRKNKHISFYKNTFWQYILQMTKYILPLISFPYLTRILGPETYGIYSYVYSICLIFAMAIEYGLNLYGTRYICQYKNTIRLIVNFISDAVLARVLVGLLLLLLWGILYSTVPIVHDNIIFSLILYSSYAIKALLPDFVFMGIEDMKPMTTRYITVQSLVVCSILLFVKSPDDLNILALIELSGSLVSFYWTLSLIQKKMNVSLKISSTINSVLKLIKKGFLYCFSNLSSSLFNGFTTFIIGLVLFDKAQIAYWSISLTIIGAIQGLFSPISNSLYPHMINKRDYRFVKNIFIIAIPFLFIGSVILVLFSDKFVSIIAGNEYHEASKILIYLTPVITLSFYSIMLGWPTLGAIGKASKIVKSTIIAGSINVVLMIVIYFCGIQSLFVISLCRIFVEFLLMLLRARYTYKFLYS